MNEMHTLDQEIVVSVQGSFTQRIMRNVGIEQFAKGLKSNTQATFANRDVEVLRLQAVAEVVKEKLRRVTAG